MQEGTQPTGESLLRLPSVEARTGLKRSAIYAGMRADPPTFPRCIKLGPRAAAWSSSSIDQWIAERIAAAQRQGGRDGSESKPRSPRRTAGHREHA
ncbi:MAG: AlpA family phage regulatory protein [Burkholderiaceae bacterium]